MRSVRSASLKRTGYGSPALSAFRVVTLVGAALALASAATAALMIEGRGFGALAQQVTARWQTRPHQAVERQR